MTQVRAFAIRGLLGQIYSRGMNTVTDRLNRMPAVSCTVQEHGFFYCGNVPNLSKAMALSHREKVLIGHSNGADAAIQIAIRLKAHGIRVRALFAVDPTPLSLPIPDNVDVAYGYFQNLPLQLGGSAIRDDISDPNVVPIMLRQKNVAHVQIDDLAEIHAEIEKVAGQIVSGK